MGRRGGRKKKSRSGGSGEESGNGSQSGSGAPAAGSSQQAQIQVVEELPPSLITLEWNDRLLENVGVELNPDNTFLQLLQQNPIVEKLLSFLHLQEMKVLSEVSRGTLSSIRKSTQFKSRVRVHISKKTLAHGLLRAGSFRWKKVLLDLTPDMPFWVMDELIPVLEQVHSLIVHIDYHLEARTIFPCLMSILKNAKSLRCLELGTVSDVQICVDMLNLHMHDNLGQRDEVDAPFYIKTEGEDDPESLAIHQKVLDLFKVTPKLRKFAFDKHVKYSRPGLGKFIPGIIQANRETLEEIEIPTQYCLLTSLKNLQFPLLRRLQLSLDIRVKPIHRGIGVAFVSRQPALEELDISMRAGLGCSILGGLLENNKLGKLVKFHFRCDGWIDYGHPIMDWEILGRMANLVEFSLRKRLSAGKVWYGSAEDILRCLPPSVESISMDGLYEDFWRSEQHDIGIILSRFKNLKNLSFHSCGSSAVTDAGFQSLITNCPNLRSLCLAGSGISRHGLRGATLNQLASLRHLKIKHWSHDIRNGDVLRALRNTSLKSFHYEANGSGGFVIVGEEGEEVNSHSNIGYSIRKDFLFELVRQNPSMEVITLAPFVYDNDVAAAGDWDRVRDEKLRLKKEWKEQAKAINPRLKELKLRSSFGYAEVEDDNRY